MLDANLFSLAKVTPSSIPDRRAANKTDLRLQLRDEIDKLAVFSRQLKAQADRVQEAADALGEELSLDGSDGQPNVRLSARNGRLPR